MSQSAETCGPARRGQGGVDGKRRQHRAALSGTEQKRERAARGRAAVGGAGRAKQSLDPLPRGEHPE
eukprot:7602404-Pyramimonas_sp.AAC.1